MTDALSETLTCYACNRPATTKEHAPPQSFFPKGQRKDLITVPSCTIHNNDNSPDVEYVRNALAFQAGLNGSGELLIDTAKRSFDRSPALYTQTFRSFVAHSPEEKVGTIKFDLTRVNAVMMPIVQALHYRDHGQKWSRWQMFVPSLGSRLSLVHRVDDGCDTVRDLLGRTPFAKRPTSEPQVFRYGSHALDWGWVYELIFYDAFVVNEFMLREDAEGHEANR